MLNDKVALRQAYRVVRGGLSPEQRATASARIADHLLNTPVLMTPTTVAVFYPLAEEVNLLSLMPALRARGHGLVLPTVQENHRIMTFLPWAEDTPLEAQQFGILQPAVGTPATPQVVLVPGLAFSEQGTRLGYGGGYYDTTLAGLAKKPLIIGVGFAVQMRAVLPCESWDVRCDGLVNEEGLTWISTF